MKILFINFIIELNIYLIIKLIKKYILNIIIEYK
jgi:hypothetical protein